MCDLTPRQRVMYNTLKTNISLADLMARASSLSADDGAVKRLMNLIMQFRKVCNHPELFERADVVAPFSFSEFGRPGPLNREGDFVQLPYSTRNPIEYTIPTLFLQDGGLLDVPQEDSLMKTKIRETHCAHINIIVSCGIPYRCVFSSLSIETMGEKSSSNAIFGRMSFQYLKFNAETL